MAILVGSGKRLTTDDGIPYMWQSGDVTTAPNEVGIMTASDGVTNDYLGYSVAVGYGKIVAGAWGDDVNGNADQGSAYIFDLNGNQLGIITASDGAANDNFGHRVVIGSGKIFVGAPGNNNFAGAAYIYDLDGTNEVKITASDGAASDMFGRNNSVAVGSGKIVVGAYGNTINGSWSGSVYIYNLDGTNENRITPSDGAANDYFGYSVAVGSGKIVVGAFGDTDNGNSSGSAYIYNLDGTGEVKITAFDGDASDYFGRDVAVGSGRIVVGAPGANAGEWGVHPGAAYVFDLDGKQLTKITPSNGAAYDEFGTSVTIGSGRIVVGDYKDDIDGNANQGSVYIYDLDGNEVGIITASNGAAGDEFGWSVAVGSGKIAVGAPGADVSSPASQGAAYVYDTPPVYNLYDAIDLNYG